MAGRIPAPRRMDGTAVPDAERVEQGGGEGHPEKVLGVVDGVVGQWRVGAVTGVLPERQRRQPIFRSIRSPTMMARMATAVPMAKTHSV